MLLCTLVVTIGLIGSTPKTVNADIFKGGFSTKISAPYKSKVLKYTVVGKLSSHDPITQWERVSSKLKLKYVKSKKDADIVIYFKTQVNYQANGGRVNGIIKPYTKSGKAAGPNDTWNKVDVFVYNNSYTKTISNAHKVLAHEMGHALGLAHTTSSKSIRKQSSIMYQTKDCPNRKDYHINEYDKEELIRKWGK